MTHALCLAYLGLKRSKTMMQTVMHQGDAGQPESLANKLENMGEKISHYQKRQHDLINTSNCSNFPDGN